ncbi:4a-hydroxytetrahydrobiopterin dehydratase [Oceanobacter mangrovi]|uniref:4a-hydroxytetrahydrobiopterin dehydratase n=1 Tax=Oceanobacter mangrovi TaxID=2862510 RepID=UPI001C8EA902|nr:4a-hydroxytetrahydrobiopterin dehydratase [Oceanobacter mangrovi]
MTLATQHQLNHFLQATPSAWQLVEISDGMSGLQLQLKTRNFAASMAIANQCAELAEQLNHHPRLTVEWGKLTVDIWSHEEGGVTGLCLQLAEAIDQQIDR